MISSHHALLYGVCVFHFQPWTLLMKFSKYISKAMTICSQAAESLRRVPVQHGWEGVATEIKVQFVPPTMCRLTPFAYLFFFRS